MQEIRDKVLAAMQDLTTDQKAMLDTVLLEILSGYTIFKKETLPAVQGDCYRDIAEFKARKEIEGVSEKTINLYLYTLKSFVEYHGTDLRSTTDDDVICWLDRRLSVDHVSKQTADSNRRNLGSFFSYMYETGKISKNPMKLVKRIRYQEKPRIALTDSEQELMYMSCKDNREMAILSTFLATGSRVSELSNLDLSDIDMRGRKIGIRCGKGGKDRTVLFNARAELYIRLYVEHRTDSNPALFVSNKDPHNRIGSRSLEKIISKIGKRAGIQHPIFPHLLRHTFATNSINHGMSIQILSKLMGHEKIDTTAIYAKNSFESMKDEYRRFIA
jgi:integrase/recombinase XerD